MVVFMVFMWVAGLIQAQQWMSNSIPFLDTVRVMNPFFGPRLFGGLLAGAGILCFVYHLWRTAALKPTRRSPVLAAGPGVG
jgi:cbb3-type cytochrome oxidase subunit 1